jgi:hypothetical protein
MEPTGGEIDQMIVTEEEPLRVAVNCCGADDALRVTLAGATETERGGKTETAAEALVTESTTLVAATVTV